MVINYAYLQLIQVCLRDYIKIGNCIIFDEYSYIENNNGKIVDTRLANSNTNNKISILEQKIDFIIKYINLQQDMKYKGLEDFSL